MPPILGSYLQLDTNSVLSLSSSSTWGAGALHSQTLYMVAKCGPVVLGGSVSLLPLTLSAMHPPQMGETAKAQTAGMNILFIPL